MNYDLAEKATKENEKLQKARRNLDLLKKEEDKFLEDRQEKAQALLVNVDKQITSAQKIFDSIIDKIGIQIKDYKERFEKFTNGLNSTVDRADKMMDSIVLIGKKTEKVEKFIGEKYVELQGFEKVLGLKDKDITQREIKVVKMMEKVDYKLKEAYNLADWAKKGKRYTIKK